MPGLTRLQPTNYRSLNDEVDLSQRRGRTSLFLRQGLPEFHQDSAKRDHHVSQGVLIIRCAYWFTWESSCFSSADSFCASTKPRQISIASSSLAPMRRCKTSSRPGFISKYHFALRFTIGIGTGQSSLPHQKRGAVRIFGSTRTNLFSFALAVNSAARFLSWTGSSEVMR